MKSIVYIMAAAMLMITFAACDSDFLEKYPPQQIAADEFWKSESDVQMGLTGCYARLRGSYITWHRSYYDAAVDNGYAHHYGDIRNMQTGTLDPANAGAANALYNACYQGIASCNVFLQNYPKASLSEGLAKGYEAEARFLRAFYYFELVQRWGGVVIYKQVPENINDLKIPKSSADDVYTFIEEDLAFAVANLKDSPYSSGHAVKTSALALEARVALFKKEWDKVISLTEQIISSGHYALANDLKSIFVKNDGQSDCQEIIFSVKYNQTKEGRQSSDGGQEVEFFRWGGLAPTKDLIDEYDFEDWRLLKWYYYSPNKTKFEREDGFVFNTEVVNTNYGLIKFASIWDDELYIPSERDILTGNDIVLFRLADVYLMYIEALIEKGGGATSDAKALNYINEIRSRAGVDLFTSSITRSDLRKERRKELAFEGLRYFDVVRWNIGSEINGKLIYGNINLKWDDKFSLWPFSQSEMDINTMLEQNPDY